MAVIDEVELELKKTAGALKYGITKSTLTTISKAKDNSCRSASSFAPDQKKVREAAYPELAKAPLLCVQHARSSNLPASSPILQEKCGELALQCGIGGFNCSDGWITPFKERYGLAFKTVSGEAAAVDKGISTSWRQTRLQCLLQEYGPHL